MDDRKLTAAAVAGGVLQIERLQGERFVEADGTDLLAHGTADNVCGSTLCQESSRSDCDSEGRGLSSVSCQIHMSGKLNTSASL